MEGEDADVVQSPDQISVISAPAAKPEEPKAEELPQAESFVAEWPSTEVAAPVPETSKAVAPVAAKPDLPTLGHCFALYDYDAEGPDELNLEEGQVRSLTYFLLHVMIFIDCLYPREEEVSVRLF